MSLVVISSAYHLCSVHVLCVCVLFVICCVYPACLCGSVLCDQEHTFPPLRYDMALLSVSRLTCGTWSLRVEYCVAIVLADSAHCVSVVLVGCSMFLTRVASSCRMEWEKRVC